MSNCDRCSTISSVWQNFTDAEADLPVLGQLMPTVTYTIIFNLMLDDPDLTSKPVNHESTPTTEEANSVKENWLALMIGNSRLHWAWFVGVTLKEAWDTDHLPAAAVEPADSALGVRDNARRNFSAHIGFCAVKYSQSVTTLSSFSSTCSDHTMAKLSCY
jgi:hypothetical protein